MGTKPSTSKPTRIALRPSKLHTFIKSQEVFEAESPIKLKAVEDRSRSPISSTDTRRGSRSVPKSSQDVTVDSINIRTRRVTKRRVKGHGVATPSSAGTISDFTSASSHTFLSSSLSVKSSFIKEQDEFEVEHLENTQPFFQISPKSKRRTEVGTNRSKNITLKLCKSTEPKLSKSANEAQTPRILRREASKPVLLEQDETNKLTALVHDNHTRHLEKTIGTKTLFALSKQTSNPVFKPKLPLLTTPLKEENGMSNSKRFHLVFKHNQPQANTVVSHNVSMDKTREVPRMFWRGKFGKFEHNSKF
mmetsp:Transcript_23810/g.42143  ORF Transcript_23810/g.42143 Transcript_23810/m.42143 type:complete len:305 (+) Transcript_23810:3553-4467(+)